MTHGFPVYSCLLDASKACDIVDHSLLFQQLLDRNTPGLLVHFFITWYSSQSCINMLSLWMVQYLPLLVYQMVYVRVVFCPQCCSLFTCMDILLNMLKDCGVGCYWDGVFVGALGCADDIACSLSFSSTTNA